MHKRVALEGSGSEQPGDEGGLGEPGRYTLLHGEVGYGQGEWSTVISKLTWQFDATVLAWLCDIGQSTCPKRDL